MLWQHWMAYQRLQDGEYRQQAEWRVLEESDEAKFKEEQSLAVLSIIRDGKVRSAARNPNSNKSKEPISDGFIA